MMFHHVNNDQVKEDTFLTNKVKSKTSVSYSGLAYILTVMDKNVMHKCSVFLFPWDRKIEFVYVIHRVNRGFLSIKAAQNNQNPSCS